MERAGRKAGPLLFMWVPHAILYMYAWREDRLDEELSPNRMRGSGLAVGPFFVSTRTALDSSHVWAYAKRMATRDRTRLTKTQMDYLKEMRWHSPLQQGWGGYGSTQVVRHLEELGLITLQYWPKLGKSALGWQARITDKGRELANNTGEGEGS